MKFAKEDLRRNHDLDGRPVAPQRPRMGTPQPQPKVNTPPIVVFMATSTPEKIRDFRFIAEEKNMPIIFDDIHELLGAFHSAEETGLTTSENAAKKLSELKPEELNTPDNQEKIKRYLQARHLDLDTPIYCGTEDSEFFVPEKVWEKTDKSGIKAESLARIEEQKKQGEAPKGMKGPGVETGPAMSGALGPYTLIKRILTAIKTLGKESANGALIKPEHTPLEMRSTLKLLNIKSPPGTAQEKFEGFSEVRLLSDSPELAARAEGEKISTYHLYTPDGEQSMVDMGRKGVAEHSARAKALAALTGEYFERGATYDHAFRHQDLLNGPDMLIKDKYKVGGFSSTNSLVTRLNDIFKQHDLYKDYEINVPDNAYHSDMPKTDLRLSDAYATLASIEDVIRDSDAAVLLPDNRQTDEMGELMKLYTLFSLEVNKQLNARDMEKPVYILNHDGSWDNALKIHYDLANSNMTKDFDISPTAYSNGNDRVRVRSTAYFDVIGASDPKRPISFEDSTKVLKKLLEIKRMGYTRRPAAEAPEMESTGTHVTRPDQFSGFKVAFFCSASCENEELNQGVNNLGYELVKDDFGVVYGGGDRYTMGALLKGVTRFRNELPAGVDPKYRAWIAGYSTEEILKSETEHGRFSSELSYHKQTKDIYQRMADMLSHSDAIVSAPGGAGTVQEWVAALILNKQYPELAKPIIFFDPPLNTEQKQIWAKALRIAVGNADYEALTGSDDAAKKAAQQKHNVYIETTEKGVMDRLHEAREQSTVHSKDEYNGMVDTSRLVSSRWAQQIAQESATSTARVQ